MDIQSPNLFYRPLAYHWMLEVAMTRSCAMLVLVVVLSSLAGAETLRSLLQSHRVPTGQFSDSDLAQPITSWAASSGEQPFLLAYYTDDGSGLLRAPLHVTRYDPASRNLRRGDLLETTALFAEGLPVNCLGSALSIGEHHGFIHIDTHVTPSARCVLLLSRQLVLWKALSAGLLGVVGEDRAIVEEGEIHFAAVHPLRIAVYDLRRDRLTEVYPPAEDPYRRQFSRALQAHMPGDDWCRTQDAACDPQNFDAELADQVAVNEAAKVFGFVARFDAGGFGDEAGEQVQPLAIAYVYRLRHGRWEHREFPAGQLVSLFDVETVDELVSRNPQTAFETPPSR